jgi:hypothetical protein
MFPLIGYLRFYVTYEYIPLIKRRHHCRWRAAKLKHILGAQGLWTGRNLSYCATGLQLFRSYPKSYNMQEDAEDLSKPGTLRVPIQSHLTTCRGTLRGYSNQDPHGSWKDCKCHYLALTPLWLVPWAYSSGANACRNTWPPFLKSYLMRLMTVHYLSYIIKIRDSHFKSIVRWTKMTQRHYAWRSER